MQLIHQEGRMLSLRKDILRDICRGVVEKFRQDLIRHAEQNRPVVPPALPSVVARVRQAVDDLRRYRFRRVVNATGVVLHTNLGRAPLWDKALEHVIETAGGYANLEYDLNKGTRGQRYDHVRSLLCLLTGAGDALVVNNNAAAVLLVLNTLAEGKEVIVSRGELIEIGGEFRIPEIMQKSGARLREVGTTNRTRLSDYARAIGNDTALLMKVHTSNFRIIGFTEDTNCAALVDLGGGYGLPVMNDLGSGCLINLESYGLRHEPTAQEALSAGVDIVTFSGDKLLGGPQAGLILGRKELVEQIRSNPLNRALRIDKMTLAALEATLIGYLDEGTVGEGFRVVRSLTEPLADVRRRARMLIKILNKLPDTRWRLEMKDGFSMAGGGSLPDQQIPTSLIAVRYHGLTPDTLEERLRKLEVPIIVRIADDEVLLDLRTIVENEFPWIRQGFESIGKGGSAARI